MPLGVGIGIDLATRREGGYGVNAAKYAQYAAFLDPRAGLYAIPDGSGGKRSVSLAEMFSGGATSVSIDTATNGVPDLVVSANKTFVTAVNALLAAAAGAVVIDSYALGGTFVPLLDETSAGKYLLSSGNTSASLWGGHNTALNTDLAAASRKGGSDDNWQKRFAACLAWAAGGRSLAVNLGTVASDSTPIDAHATVRLKAGRYAFIGIIASRPSDTLVKRYANPAGGFWAWGDSLTAGTGASDYLHQWPYQVRELLPGKPAMQNEGHGGDGSAATRTLVLAQALAPYGKNVVWTGRNNVPTMTGVLSDIADIVAYLGAANTVVIGIAAALDDDSTDQAAIAAHNAALQAAYGSYYLDPASFGLVAGDYSDNTHLNDTGYGKVAAAVYAKMVALGWPR